VADQAVRSAAPGPRTVRRSGIGEKGGKSFHFGVDVSALDGTAVYAVNGGRVSLDGQDITVIEVEDARERAYWHVVPAVAHGPRVRRGALLGHIAKG
jgi:hypothetical protein